MLTGLILYKSYVGCEFMSRIILSCSEGLISKQFSLNFLLLQYFHCSSTKYSEPWGEGLTKVYDLVAEHSMSIYSLNFVYLWVSILTEICSLL